MEIIRHGNNKLLNIINVAICCLLAAIIAAAGVYNSKVYLLLLIILYVVLAFTYDKVYQYTLYFTVVSFMVFNYNISNLGIRVGSIIIPFCDLVLALGVLRVCINLINKRIQDLWKESWSKSFCFLFLVFLVRAIYGYTVYGAMAIRDGGHYKDMMFYVVVYHELILMKLKDIDIKKVCNKYITIGLNIVFIYGIFSPWSEYLTKISPRYMGLHQELPLIGGFFSTHIWLLLLICFNSYKISKEIKSNKIKMALHFQNLISFAIICYSTSRVTFITYFFIIAILLVLKERKIAFYMMSYILIGLFVLIIVEISGAEIKVFRGNFDLDFVKNAALSAVGKGTEEEMAGGFTIRIKWITNIVKNSLNIRDFMIGKGFGMVLTDFGAPGGIQVREPHNSLISVYARMGFIGVVIWGRLILKVLVKFIKKFIDRNSIFAFLAIVIITTGCINSIVESFFEATYLAMPFYSLIAIIYFIEANYNMWGEKYGGR